MTLCEEEGVWAQTGQLANVGLMGFDEDQHEHMSSTLLTQNEHTLDPFLKSRGLA